MQPDKGKDVESSTEALERQKQVVEKLRVQWDVRGQMFHETGDDSAVTGYDSHKNRRVHPTIEEKECIRGVLVGTAAEIEALKQENASQWGEFQKLYEEGGRKGTLISFNFPPEWLQDDDTGRGVYWQAAEYDVQGKMTKPSVIKVTPAVKSIFLAEGHARSAEKVLDDSAARGESTRLYAEPLKGVLEFLKSREEEKRRQPALTTREMKDQEYAGRYWKRMSDRGLEPLLPAIQRQMVQDILGMAQRGSRGVGFRKTEEETEGQFRERLSAMRLLAEQAGLTVGNFVRDPEDLEWFSLGLIATVDREPDLGMDELLVRTYWENQGLTVEGEAAKKAEWERKMRSAFAQGKIVPVKVAEGETNNNLLTKEAAMREVAGRIAEEEGSKVTSKKVADGYILRATKQ